MRGRAALALLAATALAVVLFSLFPDLDLLVSHALLTGDRAFLLTGSPGFNWVHDQLVPKTVLFCVAVAGAAALARLFGRRILGLSLRQAVFVIAVFAIGPGLLANTLIKDHSGRPRPGDIQPFGGQERYVGPFAFDGACDKNCSFVSGDAAAAFGLLGPACLLPLRWRRRGILGACVIGAAVGLMRMMQGGHFLSDVVFAGLLVAGTTLALHCLMFRADGQPRPWRLSRKAGGN